MSTYGWFNGGVFSWFAAWGMNALIFSWLAVGVLKAEPFWVGVAQSSTMLPSLLLLLLGGAVADRFDPRRLLIGLHLLAVVPIVGLAIIVESDFLTLALLLVYGATLGSIQAFVSPARDALLSRVAGSDMMRAVTSMTLFQFGGQALGTLFAGSGEGLGLAPVLLTQAAILGAGAIAAQRIPPISDPRPTTAGSSALRQIREGLGIVGRTPNLRVPVFLVALVGVLFIGPYLVLFPLIVTETYQGGPAELSWVLMTFPVGTITGTVWIRWRGGIQRKGQAMMLALAAGALTEIVMGSGLPYPAFVVAGLFWGLAGSVFITCSRTLVQEAAPEEARGRVLSAYQVGFVGGGPLGSLASGLIAESLGAQLTLALSGVAMLAGLLGVLAFSNARKMR